MASLIPISPQSSLTSAAPGDCEIPSAEQSFPGDDVSGVFLSRFRPRRLLRSLLSKALEKHNAEEANSPEAIMNAMVRRGEIVDAARSRNASMLEDIRNSEFGEQTRVDIFKKVVGVGHVVFVLDNSSFWPGKIWDQVVYDLGLMAAVSEQCAGAGINIYLQNDREIKARGIKTPMEVNAFFEKVQPVAGHKSINPQKIPLFYRVEELSLAEIEITKKWADLLGESTPFREIHYYHIKGENAENTNWYYCPVLSLTFPYHYYLENFSSVRIKPLDHFAGDVPHRDAVIRHFRRKLEELDAKNQNAAPAGASPEALLLTLRHH